MNAHPAAPPPPRPQPDPWGVHREWVDADGLERRVDDAVVRNLREAIGEPPADLEDRTPVVTRPGRRIAAETCRVVCEDGSESEVPDGVLPQDFPLGYHRLTSSGGPDRRLIVSPGACWLPDRQVWGWTVQLYAARSRASWGIGDLADLRALREWTDRLGGGFVLVNPLHAVAPVRPQESSPYLPASRRFRNPLYLRVPEVPGWDPVDLGGTADVQALANTELVDRDEAWAVKERALRATYARTDATVDGAFVAWRREQGAVLEHFALWSALCVEHGSDWRTWPEALRRPDTSEARAYATDLADEVTFHAWLQWLLETQLKEAAGPTLVLQDLPIGVSGAGADAWVWHDVLAHGVSIGAPPDALNSVGQDWGSPPFVPWRLRQADYQPFIDAVRGTIGAGGGLRIDHVMGLFRQWWVPEGAAPTEGAYVRFPSDELLDIVALESHRAEAVVVGEDLGTVEPGVREELAARTMLAYKVLWFEDDDPAAWPRSAMATVTTHDLPTVAGLWTGSDVEDQAESTGIPVEELRAGNDALLSRLQRDGTLPTDAPAEDAVAAAYRQLARAPSALLSVALEDAAGQETRPNVPGTIDRANWRIPLPVCVDALVSGDGPDWLTDLRRTVADRGAR